ncbi:MAG TPA: Gfo/Idh/MocA family oxidoreductase [Planctomycetota bacterium]|nr:Gfo/Idh/MocA family oxidoreductase [Planctomycetota bacterium]
MKRRSFLKAAGRGIVGTGAALLVLPSRARGASPSDTLRVACIGVRGRGGSLLGASLHQRDVEVVAVCDVDAEVLAKRLQQVHAQYKNETAKGYGDFRRVLERDDIDAITAGTPDHWHAPIACMAFQAGKDVYSEKPLAHNYEEAQAMLRLAARYKRVFQLGTQIHAGDNYHRVVELVRSGALGKIHTVHVWKGGGTGVIPCSPLPPVPQHLDYDLWLGPAPWRPYHPRHVHGSFRSFLDFSTGVYADFWCHISDIAFWALGLGAPSTITARGEFQTEGMADAPKWIDVDVEFPNGPKYLWTSRRPNAPGKVGGGIGCWFEGTNGALVCDYGSREVFLGGQVLRDITEVPKSIPRSPGHERNFFDCVKTRALTESNLPYVVNMTTPMFFGRISLVLGGRTLHWDESRKQFTGDDEANRLLGRVYRQPWALPA